MVAVLLSGEQRETYLAAEPAEDDRFVGVFARVARFNQAQSAEKKFFDVGFTHQLRAEQILEIEIGEAAIGDSSRQGLQKKF